MRPPCDAAVCFKCLKSDINRAPSVKPPDGKKALQGLGECLRICVSVGVQEHVAHSATELHL